MHCHEGQSSCEVGGHLRPIFYIRVVKHYREPHNCAAKLRAQVIIMLLVDQVTVPTETFRGVSRLGRKAERSDAL